MSFKADNRTISANFSLFWSESQRITILIQLDMRGATTTGQLVSCVLCASFIQ
jgi:hypothetical protein